MRVVACDDVLHARRLVKNAHEGRMRVEAAQRREYLRALLWPGELGLHGHMDAARERSGVGHEGNVGVDAAGRADAGLDLGHVAMRKRVIDVQIAVAQRMMRALDGLSSRAGAAGDARNEEPRHRYAERDERYRREQCRGRKAPRMRDMRRL